MGNEEGDYEAAQEALGRALSIAQREQDASLEMWTLAHHSAVDCIHLHYQHGIENGLRAIELARQLNDPRTEIDTRLYVSIALMMTGKLDQAQQHATLMLSLAEGLRNRFWLGSAFSTNALLSSLRGDWQAARDLSDRGLTVAPQDIRLLANRVMIEYEVGEFSQGEACLERFLELFRLMPPGPTVRHSEAVTVIHLLAASPVS